MEEKRARFLRAYVKVPPPLRDEIIVIIDKKPYTWNTIFFELKEVKNKKLSEKLLNTLSSLGII